MTHLQARLAAAFGHFGTSKQVDWSRVNRFVFVCKGNVCRSPYAHAKAQSLGMEAISFGLETTGGVPANPAAVRNAGKRGVDLRNHVSTLFDPARLRATDLLLAFEPQHLDLIESRHGAGDAQLSLVGLWNEAALRPVIADPYGKTDAYFQVCFGQIDVNVTELVRLCVAARPDAMRNSVVDSRQT